jgi:hypothetical protein
MSATLTVPRRVHLRLDYLEELLDVTGPLGLSNLVNCALQIALGNPEEIRKLADETRERYGPGKAHTRLT